MQNSSTELVHQPLIRLGRGRDDKLDEHEIAAEEMGDGVVLDIAVYDLAFRVLEPTAELVLAFVGSVTGTVEDSVSGKNE
jgi:hypothetical protein